MIECVSNETKKVIVNSFFNCDIMTVIGCMLSTLILGILIALIIIWIIWVTNNSVTISKMKSKQRK